MRGAAGGTRSGLLAIENGEADSETVNAVFRAVHSIKGGAGAFGLDALVHFAHVFETTLDEMRAGRLESMLIRSSRSCCAQPMCWPIS